MSKVVLAAMMAIVLSSACIPPVLATALPVEEDDDVCDDNLGHLPRVRPAEVAGISDQGRVWVTEFCPGSSVLRTDGNAASVRSAIANNDVLVAALRSAGYFPDDVYAVRMMGEDTINLYVHR